MSHVLTTHILYHANQKKNSKETKTILKNNAWGNKWRYGNSSYEDFWIKGNVFQKYERNSKLCFWSTKKLTLSDNESHFEIHNDIFKRLPKIQNPWSKTGSGIYLLWWTGFGILGVFTWHRGDFHPEASSLRVPLLALYLSTWYHHKMSCRRKSPRHEFTPALVPRREFHSSTKTRSGIM